MAALSEEEIQKARANIVSVIESYGVELHQHGSEYKSLCPFHQEKTPSFTVVSNKGFYQCFGCGSSGSAIDFVMNFTSVDFRSAVEIINGSKNHETIQPILKTEAADYTPEWIPCFSVPSDAPLRPTKLQQKIDGQWVALIASASWAYKNEDGSVLGYISRFETPDGGKIHAPQTWCMNEDGECCWKWQSFGKPRPLFGLDLLFTYPVANVLIVEGEKTACAARELLHALHVPQAQAIVVSWPGGANAIKHINWTPLHGRKICLWPDADQKDYKEPHAHAGQRMPFLEQPGVVAMLEIYYALGKPETCKFIIPPSNVPDGWDLADELPAGFNLLAHLKTAVFLSQMNLQAMDDGGKPQEKEIVVERIIQKTKEELHDSTEDPVLRDNKYFRILGYDHGYYYIFHCQRGQIDAYSICSLTDKGLLTLAPLEWWETYFGGSKGGINTAMAINWIMRKAESRGIYDVSKIRGRGAWMDKKRVVFHHGDFLTVDGSQTGLTELPGNFVYEMGKTFPALPMDKLSDEDGKRIFEMATDFRWTTSASGVLLAGWIALAPLGGALNWRPHIWLQGGPASGKSSVLNHFIHPLLHGMDLYVQGNSTEAGIRQELRGDALPVLFDESESSTEKDSLRIQSILALVRQASSESQAKTFKGSAGGSALSFHIRSMFCLASIQTALTEQADKERVTVLTLKPKRQDSEAAKFWLEMLSRLTALVEDEELSGRLIRRSLNQLPITMANIKTFVHAAAKHFGAQREGDQYGTLLAGAWSLLSNCLVTPEEAMHYISLYEWEEYRENSDSNDSERAFMMLMSAFIKVPGYIDIPVSDLVLCACGRKVSGLSLQMTEAVNALANYGMKVEDGNTLVLCNNHIQLAVLMKNTPFSVDLRSVLLRYKGAKKLEKKFRFSGIPCRAYSIPLDALLDEERDDKEEEVQF